MTEERRRSKRVQILDRIHGHVAALDLDMTVLEMSLGGMRIGTTVAFPLGAEHGFRLTMGDGSVVELRGRVIRCTEIPEADARYRYVCGIQFVDDDPGEGAVSGLLNKIS